MKQKEEETERCAKDELEALKRKNAFDRLLGEFSIYTGGVRLIMLIDRGRKTSDRKRFLKQIITSTPEDFEVAFSELYDLMISGKNENNDLRIYSSVNTRDIDKAIALFKHKQIDAEYHDDEAKMFLYTHLNRKFISCLMKPECRDSRYFMIDFDNDNIKGLMNHLSSKEIVVISWHKTKKGYHIVTKPFNPILLTFPDCEVKKDAMLLFAY